MAILTSTVLEDDSASSGWVRYRYVFDSIAPNMYMLFRGSPGLNTATDIVAREPEALAWELDEIGRLTLVDLLDEADWSNSDGRPDHPKETARQALELAIALGIENADDAWRIAKKVVPWVKDQGWTNSQIANYLGITLGELGAINSWWNLMNTGTINDSYRQAWLDIKAEFDAVNNIIFGTPGASE